ncbi:gliding motility-associated C-terminal domain-containing protein [Psychroserpens sp. SPM9]|uniref:T9SS type B sorting domain-containing protein n=1 Tax=Psychroserpens sp. SPM9 TaxID=2975598 RepID=UPI0021A2BF30|nr:gliding motility-associated C-terminal domain-containing protein [Psychroserpens sp. SPM9]MDG5490913.1 gliding motility-associated C-terminal domain-containing protein [Psychroserpens sp. SPM9]
MKKILLSLSFLFAFSMWSVDAQITIDCTQAPTQINHCYGNNDTTNWVFTSSDSSPLRLTFIAGGIESCCDDILVYDGVDNTAPLIYQGNNGGDLSGLQFDSTGDSLFLEIDADGSVSCGAGSTCCTTEWDFTVACATCVVPDVDFAVRQDCINGPQFFVDVDLTDLGSATSMTLSDDQGSAPQTTSVAGVFSFGPFTNNTPVIITVENDDDANCNVTSSALTQDQCELNIVDCTQPPLQFNYCYGNNDDTAWLFESTDGSPVRLTFNAGGIESCCDDILVYDGADNTAPLIYQGNNGGNLSGLQFDSTGDSMYLEIDADGSVSCGSGSTCCTTEWDFTVACATCVVPEVDFAVRQDCINGPQFFVDVDLTDLGSATSMTLSDDQGSAPQTTSVTGVFSFGPFTNNTPVVITAVNDDDANCTVTSSALTQDQCELNIVDCTQPPLQFNYCYGNNDDTAWLFESTDGSPVRLTFNAGGIESCCDDILVYDGADNTAPLIYQGNNGGNLAGLQFDSTGDSMYLEIDADGSVSCGSGSTCCTTEWDFTVACATCVQPEATYAVVSNCLVGPEFFVDVDLSDLGSATSITISDDQGSAPQTVSAVGIVTFGPYANNTPVEITVANDDDANCTLTSPILNQEFCLDSLVDCAVGPVNTAFCYFNDIDDDPSVATFTYTSSNGLPLNLNFNAGDLEGCCDELVVIDSDGTELFNSTLNAAGLADVSGLSFQSSGDTISWYINSDFSVSCDSSTGFTPIDVTVACATCINPAATYQVIDDCENGEQFLIDVNVTTLGDATSLTISNNIDATTVSVTTEGIYQVGPFPFLQDVVITLSNDQDVNCVINSNAIQLLACPPENDNPCGATVAVVNDDQSCDLVTSGTLVEATDSGVPSGSCGGNPNDDVWFEFTALSEVQLISLINVNQGFNTDIALYEGTCDGLIELECADADAMVSPQLVIGNTYFIRVFSGGNDSVTTTFDLCIKEAPTNIICENAENFCAEAGGALTTPNIIGIPDPTDIACLGSAPNPTWNIIQIGEPGLIEIEISQVDADGNGLDVDFVLWGPFESVENACGNLDLGCPDPTNCPNNTTSPDFYPFGNIVDCSYSFVSTENLTIDNAQTGEIYLLLVTNFSDDPGTISISQTNAGGEDDGNITAEIEVDLGVDQEFCGFPDYTLNADSPFADTYEWYENGFIIEGETGPTLTVSNSNTYTVIAYDEQCDAQAQDSVTVTFGQEPTANEVDDIVTCDDISADEIEDFDLSIQTSGILGGQSDTDFNVSYHLTLADAQADENSLPLNYTNISNPQTIFVRVEDADAEFCFATTSFDLIISGPTPDATSVPLEVCDDDTDGIADFDLAAHSINILNGQNPDDFTVSYYSSEANAETATSSVALLYTSVSQTIWARVENNSAFDCYSVVPIDLIVKPLPSTTFTTDFDYEVCPNATVPILVTATANNYTESEVTIVWYQDGGVIAGENGLTLPVLEAGLYEIEVTYNDATMCSSITEQTIIELESCVIPQGISPNGDGMNDTFDLSSYDVSKLEIFNRNGTLVYSKANYTDEWYGQTNDGDELPVGTYFYTMEYEDGKRRSAWVYIQRLN